MGEVIGDHRAAVATHVAVGPEHEMIEQELPAVEQVEQRHLAIRILETVGLVDQHHGQMAASSRERVMGLVELLLLDEKRGARGLPFSLRDDLGEGIGVAGGSMGEFLFTRLGGGGVIQPIPAPPSSMGLAMCPTQGTSKIGLIRRAPAFTAFSTRASRSSTAR